METLDFRTVKKVTLETSQEMEPQYQYEYILVSMVDRLFEMLLKLN